MHSNSAGIGNYSVQANIFDSTKHLILISTVLLRSVHCISSYFPVFGVQVPALIDVNKMCKLFSYETEDLLIMFKLYYLLLNDTGSQKRFLE